MSDRFMYVPPWKLTNFGCLFRPLTIRTFASRGCDEYHNPSLRLLIPLIGEFVVFTGRHIQRTEMHLYAMSGDQHEGLIDPDCPICDEILADFASDHTVTEPRTGAERYFAEQMADPTYAAAYNAARRRIDEADTDQN